MSALLRTARPVALMATSAVALLAWAAMLAAEEDAASTAEDGARRAAVALVVGFLIAIIVGTPIGLLLAEVRVLRRAIGPVISGLQVLPSVAWVPAAIICRVCAISVLSSMCDSTPRDAATVTAAPRLPSASDRSSARRCAVTRIWVPARTGPSGFTAAGPPPSRRQLVWTRPGATPQGRRGGTARRLGQTRRVGRETSARRRFRRTFRRRREHAGWRCRAFR